MQRTVRKATKWKNGVKIFNPGAVMDGNYGAVMIGEQVEFEHLKA